MGPPKKKYAKSSIPREEKYKDMSKEEVNQLKTKELFTLIHSIDFSKADTPDKEDEMYQIIADSCDVSLEVVKDKYNKYVTIHNIAHNFYKMCSFDTEHPNSCLNIDAFLEYIAEKMNVLSGLDDIEFCKNMLKEMAPNE